MPRDLSGLDFKYEVDRKKGTFTISGKLFPEDNRKPSSTGKSIIFFTTGGNAWTEDGLGVAVTIIDPLKKPAKKA